MPELTPMRAIRAKCVMCSGGKVKEVSACTIDTCPLHPFRSGHNPNIVKRGATPAKIEALKKARDSKKKLSQNRAAQTEAQTEGSYTPET